MYILRQYCAVLLFLFIKLSTIKLITPTIAKIPCINPIIPIHILLHFIYINHINNQTILHPKLIYFKPRYKLHHITIILLIINIRFMIREIPKYILDNGQCYFVIWTNVIIRIINVNIIWNMYIM